MSESHALMLSLTVYKVVTILAGLAFAYMGYKLFVHGIFVDAGELRTNWDNRRLVLKKAAPGTFFALLGTVIVCVSLVQGLTLEGSNDAGGSGFGGNGMFSLGTHEAPDPNVQTPSSKETEKMVRDDIAALNQLSDILHRQRGQGETARLTVTAHDSKLILDVIDRTKMTLMLSAWRKGWGDRGEFKKWAQHAPGYFYGDPPSGIAQAAAIFKGEAS